MGSRVNFGWFGGKGERGGMECNDYDDGWMMRVYKVHDWVLGVSVVYGRII